MSTDIDDLPEGQPMLESQDSTQEVLSKIEGMGLRHGPILATKTALMSESGKYESFNHMSDVVGEVLNRAGTSLQEISRRGLSETSIESAQRSDIGMLQKVNQYTVTAEIARGAFGVVYLVENEEDGDDTVYAMKTFPVSKAKSPLARGRMPGMNKAQTELLTIRKEIALMKKLIHPNIVRLFEVVEESIFPHSIYMIMEYVGGGSIMSLRDDMPQQSADGSPVPPQWVCVLTDGVMGEALASKLFRQFISAMEFLHLNKVAHRDLKPENILVTIEGDLKVADFGVSHDFSSDEVGATESDDSTQLGMVKDTKGSWSYWAPEMIDDDHGNSYSAYAADVWAAGVCLWQFVFGCLPFWAPQPGNSPGLIFEEILSSKRGLPSLPSRKSPELVEVFAAVFQPDPNQRLSFHDLSQFTWLQQHSDASTEAKLTKASSLTIDRSSTSLDEEHAVTPGKVNVLSDSAKSHMIHLAQRVKTRVRERRSSIKQQKYIEIECKKETRRSFEKQTPSGAKLAEEIASIVPDNAGEHGIPNSVSTNGDMTDPSHVAVAISGQGTDEGQSLGGDRGGRTPPIPEDLTEDDAGRDSTLVATETVGCLEGEQGGNHVAMSPGTQPVCCVIL